MARKLVMKVHTNCDECRTKALEVAARAVGVNFVGWEGENNLVVIGDGMDTATLTKCIRMQAGHILILNIDYSTQNQVQKLLTHPFFWRFVGFVTSAAGLLCFALSLSFWRLFGKWNIWKIFLYGAVSIIITVLMLLPKKKWRLSRKMWLKVHILCLVFVLTSLGSFFYENVISGKLDRLGLSSVGLFSLSSLSLSRQFDVGFDVGFTNFLLGTFTLQIMQIHVYLVCVPLAVYFVMAVVRLYLESHVKETKDIESLH